MADKKKNKKPGLKETVEKLVLIATEHIATLAKEEQERIYARLARRKSTARRGTSSSAARTAKPTRVRASARGLGKEFF